ncbi:MAG: hypothetical protein Q9P01_11135 [Anaerolineae bacterium]|nr:hypothetical protein [Anaerolineae bacterium]
MDFALINAVPFVMAALLAIPQVNRLLNKTARAWLSAGVMLALFIALASYFPEVQSIDQTYKEQHGIATEVHDDEEIVVEENQVDEPPSRKPTIQARLLLMPSPVIWSGCRN